MIELGNVLGFPLYSYALVHKRTFARLLRVSDEKQDPCSHGCPAQEVHRCQAWYVLTLCRLGLVDLINLSDWINAAMHDQVLEFVLSIVVPVGAM